MIIVTAMVTRFYGRTGMVTIFAIEMRIATVNPRIIHDDLHVIGI